MYPPPSDPNLAGGICACFTVSFLKVDLKVEEEEAHNKIRWREQKHNMPAVAVTSWHNRWTGDGCNAKKIKRGCVPTYRGMWAPPVLEDLDEDRSLIPSIFFHLSRWGRAGSRLSRLLQVFVLPRHPYALRRTRFYSGVAHCDGSSAPLIGGVYKVTTRRRRNLYWPCPSFFKVSGHELKVVPWQLREGTDLETNFRQLGATRCV